MKLKYLNAHMTAKLHFLLMSIYNGRSYGKLKKNWLAVEGTTYSWSSDMSAPQQIGVGAPTGRISSVGEQTCRLPSKLPLGSRQVGYTWRWGADMSAPQHIDVGAPTGRISSIGEQTCRLPSISALGSRQVGSPENCRWGPDMSAPWLGQGSLDDK